MYECLNRIGILGAGAAGLCAAKSFLESPDHHFSVCILEQQGHVGGIWKHTPQIGTDENGIRIHSSMYDNLRTNLPKQVMEFPDFPFPDPEGDSFVHHSEVQNYLENYAKHFDLKKHIKFYRRVENIKPINPDQNNPNSLKKWHVNVTNLSNQSQENYTFDAIIIAAGSYTYPRFPNIDGLDKFQGRIMHSHDYRNNERFKSTNVLVLGAGPSGMDISLELCDVANKVILCHQDAPIFTNNNCHKILEERFPFTSLTETEAIFPDGTKIPIDVLMICTGYELKIDQFLHEDCQVYLKDRRVSPLFKHYISINNPNLAIFGLPFKVIPFPLFNTQAQALTKFWSGKAPLPTKEKMLEDEENDFKNRLKLGYPVKYAHLLKLNLQYQYSDSLAELAGIPKNSKEFKRLGIYCRYLREQNPTGYKNEKIRIEDIPNDIETYFHN